MTKDYKLNTVTYGTDAAPWLAIRTIRQCANDNAPSQTIKDIIYNSFYVDDLLHGADTVEKSQQNIKDISDTLDKGGFPLTKWNSNKKEILANIPEEKQLLSYLTSDVSEIKLLGVPYNFKEDDFVINLPDTKEVCLTKRGISSSIASFYDPIGFLLPFIMTLRHLLQKKLDEKDKLGCTTPIRTYKDI